MADDEAIRLLEEALHLHVNGERAPGGDETWADWERRAEGYLRRRLATAAGVQRQPSGELCNCRCKNPKGKCGCCEESLSDWYAAMADGSDPDA